MDTENIKIEKEVQEDVVCNCNDEFKTTPCPIHFSTKGMSESGKVIVTDANMVKEEIRKWMGYAFVCPKCGEASILDIMKYCGNCGARVIIRSKKLTDFINMLTDQENREIKNGR